jgi:hypothetical protein
VRAFRSTHRRRDRTALLQRLAVSSRPEDERTYFRILDRFGRAMKQLEAYEMGYLDLGGEGGGA